MRKIFFLLAFFISLTTASRASHVMGGEITWQCTNGNYVFTLVFYRDCNGAEINIINEDEDGSTKRNRKKHLPTPFSQEGKTPENVFLMTAEIRPA
jgi:hypothetical protein